MTAYVQAQTQQAAVVMVKANLDWRLRRVQPLQVPALVRHSVSEAGSASHWRPETIQPCGAAQAFSCCVVRMLWDFVMQM